MGSTTAVKTVLKLTETFSRHEMPGQLTSDNEPPFTLKEFKEYCEQRGTQKMSTVSPAPYQESHAQMVPTPQVAVLPRPQQQAVHIPIFPTPEINGGCQEDRGAEAGREDPRRVATASAVAAETWRNGSLRNQAYSTSGGSRAQSRERPKNRYED
uniref:Integrase catalytic domain-containing protein n=1 Tax=Haemonchus contortus TaxID=6289 RepID=A0A7I4Z5R4_HAECO